MENNLPDSWIVSKIEMVVSNEKYSIVDGPFGSHLKRSEYVEEGVPLIRILNIGEYYKFISRDLIKITNEKFEQIKRSEVNPGDILFSKAGTIGRVCFVPDTIKRGAITSSCAKIKIHECLNSKYFLYQLSSDEVYNYLINIATGSTRLNLNLTSIKSIPVKVPPYLEQNRIVNKLDALMEKVESNKQRLDKIPTLLKRFRQSVLAAAVSGRLTEDWRDEKDYDLILGFPISWRIVKIDKLLKSLKTDLRTGPFGTALKKSEHQLLGVPVWGIESIGGNGSFTGHNKIFVTKDKAKELKSFEVKGGDIIISRSGTVGEICILPENVEYGLISTNLMKIVLDNEIIDSKFFCWLFDGSPLVIDKLRELCTGSTRIFLTQTILKQLDYPLPPFKEQQEIIHRVEQLFAFADKIEARYTKAKSMLDKLPQSILAKAFRGELVPQDPNDEPASVLLERIKAEKIKIKEKNQEKIRKRTK